MILADALQHEGHVVEIFAGALELNFVRVGWWFGHDTRAKPPYHIAPGLLCVGWVTARQHHLTPSPRRILYLDSRLVKDGTTAIPDASVTLADPLSIVPGTAAFKRPNPSFRNLTSHRAFEAKLEQTRALWLNHAAHWGYSLAPYAIEKWPRILGLNITEFQS